jgi:hypothetical protein
MLSIDEINMLWTESSDGKLYWNLDRGKNKVKGKEAGTVQRTGYKYVMYSGKLYSVHRIIFFKNHGYLPKEIDHINCIKTDNRIENLREATRSQNQWNRASYKNSKTKVKGVSLHGCGKYSAELKHEGKKHYLGLFKTIEEATKVVMKKREELQGEFTNHG